MNLELNFSVFFIFYFFLLFSYPSIFLSFYPSILLSFYPYILLFFYPSILLSYYPSILLSFYTSILLTFYQFILLSFYPSILLSFYSSILSILSHALEQLKMKQKLNFNKRSALVFYNFGNVNFGKYLIYFYVFFKILSPFRYYMILDNFLVFSGITEFPIFTVEHSIYH